MSKALIMDTRHHALTILEQLREWSHRILPYPSAYNGNYSHVDGGIMDGWWRGVGDDDGYDLVTSQDFIKFWGKFLLLFCLSWLEFHRDLKLFESIWKLHWKTILNFLLFSWRTSLRKIKYQILFFHPLFKPMQACLQRSESQMCFI
jgi:hypothetical protein